jgi:hypothetical protein
MCLFSLFSRGSIAQSRHGRNKNDARSYDSSNKANSHLRHPLFAVQYDEQARQCFPNRIIKLQKNNRR